MTDDSITGTDFVMWEDELIYGEIEEGIAPWTFTTEQEPQS